MSLEGLPGAVVAFIQTPFFQLIKFFIITPLNFFTSDVAEIYGLQGKDSRDRPDLRELHKVIFGNRRLPFGCLIIAKQRGVIIEREWGESKRKGVYTEDFNSIIDKWTY